MLLDFAQILSEFHIRFQELTKREETESAGGRVKRKRGSERRREESGRDEEREREREQRQSEN